MSYLTKRKLRVVRMRVVYAAIKPIVRQLAEGKLHDGRSQHIGLSKVLLRLRSTVECAAVLGIAFSRT